MLTMKVIFKFGTLFNSALFDMVLSTRPIKFFFKKTKVKEIIDRLSNTRTIHEKFELLDQQSIKENNIFEEKENNTKKVKQIEHSLSYFDKLKEYGLSKQKIKKIIQDNSEEVIRKAIQSVDVQIKKGTVKNKKAMICAAINERWEIGKYIPRGNSQKNT